MKFERTAYSRDRRGWSPQRIAAAKRAIARDREANALTPELVRDKSLRDRQARMDRREDFMTTTMRASAARSWREARRRYFALPATRREGIRRFWSCGIYPLHPSYLLTALDQFQRPGRSPWTYLRKRRLVELWRETHLPRPPGFQSIVRDFSTL